jgi:hypothetical protein
MPCFNKLILKNGRGGGEFGEFFFWTPLSEIFQKSGDARTPLYVRDCLSTLRDVECISAVLHPKEFAGVVQVIQFFSGREAWPCTATVLPRPTSSSTCHRKKNLFKLRQCLDPLDGQLLLPSNPVLAARGSSCARKEAWQRGLAQTWPFFNIY